MRTRWRRPAGITRPGYVIPSDYKWFAQALVSDIVVDALEHLDLSPPKLTADEAARSGEGASPADSHVVSAFRWTCGSRFAASAPANTKLGAAKRAAGDIDHCLGSRRLRGVIARWPAAAFWCDSVAPTSNVCWSRCRETRSR